MLRLARMRTWHKTVVAGSSFWNQLTCHLCLSMYICHIFVSAWKPSCFELSCPERLWFVPAELALNKGCNYKQITLTMPLYNRTFTFGIYILKKLNFIEIYTKVNNYYIVATNAWKTNLFTNCQEFLIGVDVVVMLPTCVTKQDTVTFSNVICTVHLRAL